MAGGGHDRHWESCVIRKWPRRLSTANRGQSILLKRGRDSGQAGLPDLDTALA